MKGITPVISTILLLLITVSLIGAVYMFFISQTELTTKGVEEGTQNTLNALNTKIRIVFVEPGSSGEPLKIYVRNTGTVTIRDSDTTAPSLDRILTVFVDGVPKDGSWLDSSGSSETNEITVGSTVLFQTDEDIDSCEAVKIDTPGQSAAATC
ncbi:MAG: hypothetical protein HY364_03520 [Candidatus Aenigmarchaeota archaeon]|nr:hypothetical protein [Candidatus Aenigmarchaeota archaeon]